MKINNKFMLAIVLTLAFIGQASAMGFSQIPSTKIPPVANSK